MTKKSNAEKNQDDFWDNKPSEKNDELPEHVWEHWVSVLEGKQHFREDEDLLSQDKKVREPVKDCLGSLIAVKRLAAYFRSYLKHEELSPEANSLARQRIKAMIKAWQEVYDELEKKQDEEV